VRCRPASLSWLGGVIGQRVAPLGVDRFGQTGSLSDLYAAYRLDGDAITQAIAEAAAHAFLTRPFRSRPCPASLRPRPHPRRELDHARELLVRWATSWR
jgi:hypothetical protein